MTTHSSADIQNSLRSVRRLPALKDIDQSKGNTLKPMNSSPAKLTSTPDAHTRKGLGGTMTNPKVEINFEYVFNMNREELLCQERALKKMIISMEEPLCFQRPP